MSKIIFTGPTCYLGEWYFTSLKVYDIQHYGKEVFYVVADNNKNYYMKLDNINKNSGHLSYFTTLEKWREIQVNKILKD